MKNSKKTRQVRLNFSNKKGQEINIIETFDAKVSKEEMGATIVARFLRTYQTYRRFQGKSNKGMGFNFAQNFEVSLVVDSRKLKSKTWENIDVNGSKVDLGVTLVNSEEGISTFLAKIELLVMDLFDSATLKVKTFDEAKKLFKPQLN